MADPLDPPANWFDRQPTYRNCWRRVRLVCHQLETRDTTGNILTGFVAAVLGDPAAHPTQVVGQLVGDWAMSGDRPGPAADEPREVAAEEPAARWLTPADRWLDPLPGEIVPSTGQERFAPSWLTASDDGSGLRRRPMPLPEGESATVTVVRPDRPAADTAVPTITAPTESAGLRSLPTNMTVSWPGSVTPADGFQVGTRAAMRALDPIDIPNKAPTAVDDEVTVNEDESVVFDPTANDTDPDGDPLWVKYVQAETANGRTFWEEGGDVRYIPNPDFNGTDTFSYTVTDGLAEYDGYVTVTVNPVNDPVYAFDDAETFIRPEIDELPPDKTVPLPGSSDYLPWFNDIDPDGDVLTVTPGTLPVTDMSGQPAGTVDLSQSYLYWNIPWDFFGKAYFEYEVSDGHGSSAKAKMWVWALHEEGATPTISAEPDQYFVGDDPLQAGPVTANDAGADLAILASHTSTGRIVSFDNGGTFKYLPAAGTGDESFQYVVYTQDGRNRTTGQVNLSKVNLTIHHGQGGAGVSELNERVAVGGTAVGGSVLIPVFKATGGFTVANFNDSNANGKIDCDPNERSMFPNPQFPGSGEVDLMKLTLAKPAGATGNISLTVTTGAVGHVVIWRDGFKANDRIFELTGSEGTFQYPVNQLPGELWIELCGVSGAVGDVTITSDYKGAKDTVSATGIWTKNEPASPHWPAGHFMKDNSGLRASTTPGLWLLPEDADGTILNSQYRYYTRDKGLGLVDMAMWNPGPPNKLYRTANYQLSKFTLQPSGLAPYVALSIVYIDAARSCESLSLFDGKQTLRQRPLWIDAANDDDYNQDVDLRYGSGNAVTDAVYQFDGPGMGHWHGTATQVTDIINNEPRVDYVQRYNGYDFVRVGFSGQPIGGDGLKGSRASVIYPWHSITHLRANPPDATSPVSYMKRFAEPTMATENRIDVGLININKIGG